MVGFVAYTAKITVLAVRATLSPTRDHVAAFWRA